MKVNGRFVRIKVKPSRPPEILQTLRLYDVTNDCWHDDIPILDPTEEDLEVRIRSTVVSTLGHTVHRPWSVAAPPKQWPNFDDDLQAADGAGGEREGSEDEFSDDSASNSRAASRAGNNSNQDSLSLFDRIMNDAAKQAYDPQIGQYVHKRRAARALQQAERESQLASELSGDTDLTDVTPAITFHGLDTEFDYIKRMKNERHAMTYNVAKRNKLAREARLKGEDISATPGPAMPSVPRQNYQPCELCRTGSASRSWASCAERRREVAEGLQGPDRREGPEVEAAPGSVEALRAVQARIFACSFRQKFRGVHIVPQGHDQFQGQLLTWKASDRAAVSTKSVESIRKKKPGALVPLGKEQLEPVLQDMAFLH